ncbi:zinc-binding dehydrogenase [Sphingopyxis sp. 2PD]|uniref:zinc-binding dehydrogenase n=1 Tax=Sphingopyxis sp. 2PD TaxID=2502196 RepID=UPI001484CA04|nr:zinc-binding dehydrogenase [Sphingopyxis sp. 2PD]
MEPSATASSIKPRILVAFVEANGIRPLIDSSFGLDRLGDAFRYQLSGGHIGKIVIDLSGR